MVEMRFRERFKWTGSTGCSGENNAGSSEDKLFMDKSTWERWGLCEKVEASRAAIRLDEASR